MSLTGKQLYADVPKEGDGKENEEDMNKREDSPDTNSNDDRIRKKELKHESRNAGQQIMAEITKFCNKIS